MRYSKFILCSLLLLTGCSSVSLRDSLSDAGAATVAATVATINPVAGIAAGVATGVTINTVTEPEGVSLEQIKSPEQAAVATEQIQADRNVAITRELILGGGAVFLLWTLLTWWIGARRQRPEDRKLETERDEHKGMVKALVMKQMGITENDLKD